MSNFNSDAVAQLFWEELTRYHGWSKTISSLHEKRIRKIQANVAAIKKIKETVVELYEAEQKKHRTGRASSNCGPEGEVKETEKG